MADASKECVMHEVRKYWQDGKNLGQCMLEMFQQGLWTDVVFKCMDHDKGEEVIKAHKNVLASRSSVFQAMFFGPCADTTDVVELKDREKEILHLFLVYIYSDSITLTEGTAFAVLEMAHYYQVTNLVMLCSEFLKTVLTASNVCETLTLARFYNLYGLRDACCSFIDSHAQDVIQTESFMNISEDCLLYILKGDTLYVEEEYILEAVESWARRKLGEKDVAVSGTDIRKRIGESFYFLRLPTMSSQTLRESVSRKGYFSVEEYADIAAFINKAENISVTTNSCIARVPELETVNVNNQDGETRYFKNLHISFEITMLKSAFLSRLDLGEINPYLVNTQDIYTDEGNTSNFAGEVRHGNSFKDATIDFDSFFRKKVLRISTLDRPRHRNYYVTDMYKFVGSNYR
ncbi:BTB/POZ domain-containing protein 3-like [Ruditapes philippinarum]|uniref:BTB/POZ domain-containing protein 3-like n=1 Tax=Ruditapes philippinarum TaxID=129788 RepID=UPI00295A8E2C|nr:BTB/POZ domain-containing protein 3-like [Ruditapes philippinarum]XP_060557023.1 BTB/POZ domain-containing protein 3-like [Ruditapes philippinarum]